MRDITSQKLVTLCTHLKSNIKFHANVNDLTRTERAHLQWIPNKLLININPWPSFCCPILDLIVGTSKRKHFKRVPSHEMHLSMDDTIQSHDKCMQTLNEHIDNGFQKESTISLFPFLSARTMKLLVTLSIRYSTGSEFAHFENFWNGLEFLSSPP